MKRAFGVFEHKDGTVDFELLIHTEKVMVPIQGFDTGTIFFLREADDNKGGHIVKEDINALTEDLTGFYNSYNRGIISSLYVYDLQSKVWDEYSFSINSEKEMNFNFSRKVPQYEIEMNYGITLARSKQEYIEQTKADIAFMKAKLKEPIENFYTDDDAALWDVRDEIDERIMLARELEIFEEKFFDELYAQEHTHEIEH